MTESEPPDAGEHPRDRIASYGVWLAAAAAVASLLLPWSQGDGYTRDAFGRSGWAPAIVLTTVVGVVVLLARYRDEGSHGRPRALRLVAGFGGVISAIAALAIAVPGRDSGPSGAEGGAWGGPGLLLVAMAVLMSATRLLGNPDLLRRPARPEPSRTLVAGGGLAAGGLTLALVGLVGPWEQLRSPVLDPLVDATSIVRTGLELPATVPLRWAVLGAAVLGAAALALRPSRTLPVVAVAGGVAVLALSVPHALADEYTGVNATLAVGAGPWITAAGGLLAVVGGVVAVTGRRTASGGLVAAVVIVLAGLDAGKSPTPATADPLAAHIVFRGTDDPYDVQRLGGAAVDADVDDDEGAGTSTLGIARRDVLATHLGTFFTTGVDEDGSGSDAILVQQIVRGRALPVTELSGVDDASLLGVVRGRLLVQVHSYSTYAVVSVSMHAAQSYVATSDRPSAVRVDDDEPALLLTSSASTTPEPGRLRTEQFRAELTPDGGAVLHPLYESASYVVSPATVRSGEVWTWRTAPRSSVAGLGSRRYVVDGGAISRVDDNGVRIPVVGGVSDLRCTLSRDPLSSSLSDYYLYAAAAGTSIDDRGDVWFLLRRSGTSTDTQVLVRSRDGVLRRPTGVSWRNPRGLHAMPDGSLFVEQDAGKRDGTGIAYRVDDAAAAATAAPALGPVADGCVSDNRVRVATAHRTVTERAIAALPRDSHARTPYAALVDTRGTQVYADQNGANTKIVWLPVTGRPRTVLTVGDVFVGEVVADGRGGAWWTQFPNGRAPKAAALGHVDAAGHARIVRRGIRAMKASKKYETVDLSADPEGPAVWLRWTSDVRWTRYTTAGVRSPLDYTGALPVLRGGRGYVVTDPTVGVRTVSAKGAGGVVLGGAKNSLALPSAVATKSRPSGISAYGAVLVDAEGRLLFHRGDYLARLDAGRVELLAGPEDGLPYSADSGTVDVSDVVFGSTLVVYGPNDTIHLVDIS